MPRWEALRRRHIFPMLGVLLMQAAAPPMSGHAFAILTSIVAPAVLTNACSVLALGTGNGMVDRTRVINSELIRLPDGSPDYPDLARQLDLLRVRSQFLLKGLTAVYAALGGFAASALVSVLGAVAEFRNFHAGFWIISVLAFVVGIFAVTSLVIGCTLMVRESRLALQSMAEEADLARRQFESRSRGAERR
jgi:hypothetical protein